MKRTKTKNDIDWSIFIPGDETNVYCRCGRRYSSYAKGIWVSESDYKMHSSRACPDCGKDDDIYRTSDYDDWERVTITQDDVGGMDVKDILK